MILDKKGQALIEFIMILPILIFSLLIVFDIGNFLYNKNKMQSQLNDIIDVYKKDSNITKLEEYVFSLDNNYNLDLDRKDNYLEFKLQKKPQFFTPGLKLVLNKDIEVKRVIQNVK